MLLHGGWMLMLQGMLSVASRIPEGRGQGNDSTLAFAIPGTF